MHPEYMMPEESKDAIDDQAASHARAWEFKGEQTMHPVWAVERLTDDERREAQKGAFNMKLKDIEFEFLAVTVGAVGTDPFARTFVAVAHIMTNAVAVEDGGRWFRKHRQE